MLKKKLLTIAGVLGILACGACFLPPIHTGPPAPPPLPFPELKDIHTVRVFVTDNSVPAHIDTAAIATVVANSVNFFRGGAGITAYVGGDPADADLTVVISNEKATLKRVEPSEGETWFFDIGFSESIKNASGEILKQRSNLHVRCFSRLPAKHPDDVWSVPEAKRAYGAAWGYVATHGMFF
ncbi:MAG: hypothetical protein ABR928_04855 [Terracidiphilus sp.]|jgi:hypothetical protein